MCGIAGFIDARSDRSVLENMTAQVERRGPDSSGIYFREGVGLGHRRLAVLDLSDMGRQPMGFEKLTLVFNGEIYNFREIRQELEGVGYAFQSDTDTEVVLKAFHCWGQQCVHRFLGMFVGAIRDENARTLHLFRDRAGVKPLFFYNDETALAFGSTLACLRPYLKARGLAFQLSRAAVSEFLRLGYASGSESFLAGVQRLPPAHWLTWRDGEIRLERYWQPVFRENAAWQDRADEDLLDELEPLVVSAFRYRMVSDVPVGVFLSAGVDSSLVTAVLTRHCGRLRTFTVGFAERSMDESEDARKIATALGSEHRSELLDMPTCLGILDRFYRIFDEPQADNSCFPTFFVAQLAREAGVKVGLSADAGDELFGGYTRYLTTLQRYAQVQRIGRGASPLAAALQGVSPWLPDPLAGRLGRFGDILGCKRFLEFYQTIIRGSARLELRRLYPDYQDDYSSNSADTPLNQMSQWDFEHYMHGDILTKVDRSTMWHSIEGREPFLDHRLVEFAAQLPQRYKIRNGQSKFLLRRLLARYLPPELCQFPKRGFAMPLLDWMRGGLREPILDVLGSPQSGLFDRRRLKVMLARFQARKSVNLVLLWHAFHLELWHQQWKWPL